MTSRTVFDPAVSVIVPVHNAAATIDATLASLFAQTLERIEIIAVDDASRDESAQILQRIAEREPRLKVLRLDQNGGVHEARAAGLRMAGAQWIGFVDADDFARPQMYATVFEAAVREGVDVVVCSTDRVTQDRKTLGPHTSFRSTGRFDDHLFDRYCRLDFGNGSLWNKIYRADNIRRWGARSFRWRQDANEDTLVNLGVFSDARSVCVLPQALYEYVFNPRSATSSSDNYKAFTLLLRAYAIAIDQFADAGAGALTSITSLYRRQIDYGCYQLPDGALPPEHMGAVAEAITLLGQRHPAALALLAARMQQPMGSGDAQGATTRFGHLLGKVMSILQGRR